MPTYGIIVNPTSGVGNGGRSIPTIEQKMHEMGLDYRLARTERPGHAIELARAMAREGCQVVVSAGGDGTANEVLNGLAQAKAAGEGQPIMAILPVGRGNDFAFGMGAPFHFEAALQALAARRTRWVDVGRVTGGNFPDGRIFGNGIGIGFDAVVGFESLKLKPLSGFASYAVAALLTIFLYYKAPEVKLEMDDQTITLPSLMVSVMNGRRMGGGFMMAPESQQDDGMFDVCIARQVGRFEILKMIPRFMNGTQAGHPAIQFRHTRRLVVTALSGSLPAHADGETVCTAGQTLTLEIIPRQVELIVAP